MSSISKCPRCAQPVTIPDRVAAEALVRCPLCAAEYPLGDALAGVPPTLIVVETAAVVATGAETVDLRTLAEIPPLPPPPAPPVGESVVEPRAEVVQAKAADEVDYVRAEAEAEEAEEPGAEDETFAAAAFAGLRKEPASGDGKEPPSGVPRRPARRKTKKRNPVKELIGVVFGGFFGLLIGYYVLAWCGLAGRLPDLKLPFLPPKQSAKPESETKTEAEPDNAESRAPEQHAPFDRFAAHG
jgi:hypothetical protein